MRRERRGIHRVQPPPLLLMGYAFTRVLHVMFLPAQGPTSMTCHLLWSFIVLGYYAIQTLISVRGFEFSRLRSRPGPQRQHNPPVSAVLSNKRREIAVTF